MPTPQNLLLLLTLLLSALVAGLLYGYACSVNPGLARLPDGEYLRAMQAINAAIQNLLFFLSFMGTLVMLPLCAWLSYRQGNAVASRWLLAASIVYAVGVVGVTAAGNIPLNNALASFRIDGATDESLRQQRLQFEQPWNSWHTLRTICAAAAFLLAAFPVVRRMM